MDNLITTSNVKVDSIVANTYSAATMLCKYNSKIAEAFLAIDNRNIEKLTNLLDDGVDINAVNLEGDTLLIHAVNNKKQDMAIFLLDNGADINVRNLYNRNSAFYLAIWNCDIGVINKFIERGINVNKSITRNKEMPLITAVISNKLDIVKALLNAGANIHKIDNTQKTALELARIFVGDLYINRHVMMQKYIDSKKIVELLQDCNLKSINKTASQPFRNFYINNNKKAIRRFRYFKKSINKNAMKLYRNVL